MGVDRVLWRAVAGFRAFAWVYAVVLYARVQDDYAHPVAGWLVLAALGLATLLAPAAYSRPRWRGVALGVDLAAAVGSLLPTGVLDTASRVEAGAQTLPVVWPAAAVISWGLALGWVGGLVAALAVACAGFVERGRVAPETVHNSVLLLLAGTILGYAASLARSAQRQIETVRAAEAALAERERLGRAVHDGVLQVLALTARRGAASDDPDLLRLAEEADRQERSLRALVSSPPVRVSTGTQDLAARLTALAGPGVTVAVPPGEVELPLPVAEELSAAVVAALDNVARHAGEGAHAWVLLEDTGRDVLVSVRDDGRGFAPERLAGAAQAGRMGVRSSIRGRIADLGGSVRIASAPGAGTEVELTVPRSPVPRGAPT